MSTQDETVKPYSSGHALARAAALLLGIFAFTSLPLVGLSLSNMRIFQLLQSVLAKVDPDQMAQSARDTTWVLSKGMLAVATVADQLLRPVMLLGLLAGVVCLVWIYRAYSNLPALGARDLKFTPEWAVGWWFMPFLHFFRPYQVMHELWHASDPGTSDEAAKQVGAPATLLGWWWAFFVGSLILRFYYPYWAKVTAGTVFGTKITADPELFYVEATAATLNICAAVLAIVVILMIDRMQTEKHRQASSG